MTLQANKLITGSEADDAGSYECEGNIYTSRDSTW